MLTKTLIHHGAPTLAGLKVANLFCYRGELAELDQIKEVLQAKGIYLRLLKKCKGKLIYVYRRSWLEEILSRKEHQAFLGEYGHQSFSIEELLDSFEEKMKRDGFPHEIGLLLGYPLEDVKGFIEHRGEKSLCCGHWKVYGDKDRAQRDFLRFHDCTTTYVEWYQQGKPLEHLALSF